MTYSHCVNKLILLSFRVTFRYNDWTCTWRALALVFVSAFILVSRGLLQVILRCSSILPIEGETVRLIRDLVLLTPCRLSRTECYRLW